MCKENTLGPCTHELYVNLEQWIRFRPKKRERKAFQAKPESCLVCFPCLEKYLFFF